MDTGPINAIRPVSMVRPSSPISDSSPDLRGVFAAEFRSQQRDDAYSPSRKASRGLEDEEAEEDSAGSESASPHPTQSPQSSINFFA